MQFAIRIGRHVFRFTLSISHRSAPQSRGNSARSAAPAVPPPAPLPPSARQVDPSATPPAPVEPAAIAAAC